MNSIQHSQSSLDRPPGVVPQLSQLVTSLALKKRDQMSPKLPKDSWDYLFRVGLGWGWKQETKSGQVVQRPQSSSSRDYQRPGMLRNGSGSWCLDVFYPSCLSLSLSLSVSVSHSHPWIYNKPLSNSSSLVHKCFFLWIHKTQSKRLLVHDSFGGPLGFWILLPRTKTIKGEKRSPSYSKVPYISFIRCVAKLCCSKPESGKPPLLVTGDAACQSDQRGVSPEGGIGIIYPEA